MRAGSDAFWKHSYKWALRTSHMLAAFNVAWFEEPLKPDSMRDYVLLRQNSPVPIAGGRSANPATGRSSRGWRRARWTSFSPT